MQTVLKTIFGSTAELFGEWVDEMVPDYLPRMILGLVIFSLALMTALAYAFGWVGALAIFAVLVLVNMLSLNVPFWYSVLAGVLLKLVQYPLAKLISGSYADTVFAWIHQASWVRMTLVIFAALLPLVMLKRSIADIGTAFARHTERETNTNNTVKETHTTERS